VCPDGVDLAEWPGSHISESNLSVSHPYGSVRRKVTALPFQVAADWSDQMIDLDSGRGRGGLA